MKLFFFFLAVLFTPVLFSQSNNALHFDGVNDYVSTTKSSIQGNAARSFEAWIRTNENCIPGTGGGVQQVIADMGSFVIGKRFTFNLLFSNSVRLEIGGSGVSGTVAVNDSLWHHVAAVYDPTANKKITLYVDGIVSATGNFSATPATTAGNVVIGRRIDGANPFGGDIDEFRLWNIALTDSDVLAHMNGEICAPPANLVLYYTMNGGTANGSNAAVTSLTDQSGNNNGTLQNFGLSGSSSNWTYGQNISQTVFDTVTTTVCQGYPIPDSSGYWDVTGVYNWTFTQNSGALTGCDSTVTYDITVDTVDTRTAVNGIVLSALATNASFQWMDCSDSTLISGATSATYVASSNGDYAVEVTQGNCSQWSDCITIANIGLVENSATRKIYPNPTSAQFYVPKALAMSNLFLYDLNGRLLAKMPVVGNSVQLPERITSGMYVVRNMETGWSALLSVE